MYSSIPYINPYVIPMYMIIPYINPYVRCYDMI